MEKTAASKFGSSPAKLRFFTIFASDYPTDMNFRKISLLVLILLIADQALKIWVKTHMHLDESIVVFPDWFQLRFIENNGAAFGMHIATKGGFDWGKLLLGIFRIVMVGVIGWLMHHLCTKRQSRFQRTENPPMCSAQNLSPCLVGGTTKPKFGNGRKGPGSIRLSRS